MNQDALESFLKKLPEKHGTITIDQIEIDELLDVLEDSFDERPENMALLLSQALEEHGERDAASTPGVTYRGRYHKREIRIKRASLLGIVAALASLPFFATGLTDIMSWKDCLKWLSTYLGVSTLQVVGFFETFFQMREFELDYREEKVHKHVFDFHLRESKIIENIRSEYPNLSNEQIKEVFHKMESHRFVSFVEKDGEKWYKLNAKWKKAHAS